MEDMECVSICQNESINKISSVSATNYARCVFCGMDDSAKFGQGELLRFRTAHTASGLPGWYTDAKCQFRSLKHACSRKLIQLGHEQILPGTAHPMLAPTDHMVGDHCALDAYRKLQEGKILESDGKPVLSGLPNTFSDSEGRPFGYVDELCEIGWPLEGESEEKWALEHLLVACAPKEGGEGSWLYAHHCCISWSDEVVMNDQVFEGVEDAARKAIQNECALCRRLGASLSCRFDGCRRSFHFPCAAGAGCYQEIKSLTIYCPSHLDSVLPGLGENITPCLVCDQANNVTEMIFCTSCGNHFHNPCLEPPLILSTTVRVGWQCPECKMCLICSESKDETKMVICDVCDKGFHTYCLKPPVTNIPKNGFKCDRCRVCMDCGLRRFSIPKGFGAPNENENNEQPTSRWHSNYTLCDRCFQTRKRPNLCCAVCDRAWRCCVGSSGCISDVAVATANTSMPFMWPSRQCTGCRRMVHYDCDPSKQSFSSTHSSPSLSGTCGESSEDVAVLQGGGGVVNGYLCPTCRNRGSATPSEVLSAAASLRTSPFVGGAGSSDLGDANSIVASASPSLTDDQQHVSSSSITLPTRASVATSNADSTSTTPTTDPGKQTNSLITDAPTQPTVLSKLPRGISSGTRTYKTVGRPPGSLTKSRSVSTGIGEMGRKRVKMDQTDACKPSSKLSSNIHATQSQYVSSTNSQFTKTVGAKRSPSFASSNAAPVGGGTRARRSKNRKNGACEPKSNEESDDHPSTAVIFPRDDEFMQQSDICLPCGSIGNPDDLLACAQCGQCYHYFCADVSRITDIMRVRGWRCYNCTICETCGQSNDENLLLLCDNCDISYHTYCLKPALPEVPKGGWKCDNCVSCERCGRRSPGVNGQWHENYTICSPCVSRHLCPTCTISYKDDELLILCSLCERWAHGGCDQIRTEEEADFVVETDYICPLCRDRGSSYGANHQQLLAFRSLHGQSAVFTPPVKGSEGVDSLFADRLPSALAAYSSAGSSAARSDDEQESADVQYFFMDGVVINWTALNTIRKGMLKGLPKRQTGVSRQKNSQALNAATPEVPLATYPEPPSVCHPADEEASQHSGADVDSEFTSATYGEMAKSPRSVVSEEDGAHGGGGTCDSSSTTTGGGVTAINSDNTTLTSKAMSQAPSAAKKAKLSSAAARRHLNLGIGGFRSRPCRVYNTKKSQMVVTAAAENVAPPASKKRRSNKKKSDLEELYPDYLMQAFYGDSVLSTVAGNINADAVLTGHKRNKRASCTTPLGGVGENVPVTSAGQLQPDETPDKRTAKDSWIHSAPTNVTNFQDGSRSPVPGVGDRQHMWTAESPGHTTVAVSGKHLLDDNPMVDGYVYFEDGETMNSFDDEGREDVDEVFNIPSDPVETILQPPKSPIPISRQRNPQSESVAQVRASPDEVSDYMLDDLLSMASNFGSPGVSTTEVTQPIAASSTGVHGDPTSVTSRQRFSASVPQGSLSLGLFTDQSLHPTDQFVPAMDHKSITDLPHRLVSDIGYQHQQPQNRSIFPDDGHCIIPPSLQDVQHPELTLSTVLPVQQVQPETNLLPELSVTDIESQLNACERHGDSSAVVTLSSEGTPPPTPQQSVGPQIEPLSTQTTLGTPFHSLNDAQPVNPAYLSRNLQYAPRGVTSQHRPQFHFQQQQQQQVYTGNVETGFPPPPPPYPGSRPSTGWRLTKSQRYAQPLPHATYGTVSQQQQAAQQRFQTAVYRGVSPSIISPSVTESMSPKTRQSPFPMTYEHSHLGSDSGMFSNQQLKTMLRQEPSPRRSGEMPLGGMVMTSEGLPAAMVTGGSMPIPPMTGTVSDATAGGGSGVNGGVGGGGGGGGGVGGGPGGGPGTSTSRRVNIEKWEDEERRGKSSTIAPVLYANLILTHLRSEIPDPQLRARKIQTLWRRLPPGERAQFVNHARANKTKFRASTNTMSLRGCSGNVLQSTHQMLLPSSLSTHGAGSGGGGGSSSCGTTSLPQTPVNTPMPCSTPVYVAPSTPGSTPGGGRSSGGSLMDQGGIGTTILPNFSPSSATKRHPQSFPPPVHPSHQHVLQTQTIPSTANQMHPSAAAHVVSQSPLSKTFDHASDQRSMEGDRHVLTSTPDAALRVMDTTGICAPSQVNPSNPTSSASLEETVVDPMPPVPSLALFQSQPPTQIHDPPSVAASQPSPSLSPSSLLGGVMMIRRGSPTSLPSQPCHSTESHSPPVTSTLSPFQQPQATAADQVVSQPQMPQRPYPPHPPPTWPSTVFVGASPHHHSSHQPARWPTGGHPSPVSPSPTTHQQHLLLQQRQLQQQQQQHLMASSRSASPYGSTQMMQQTSTSMQQQQQQQQHYGMGGGGGQTEPTTLHAPPHTPGPIVDEVDRRKIREFLTKKADEKILAAQQQKQQHMQSVSPSSASLQPLQQPSISISPHHTPSHAPQQQQQQQLMQQKMFQPQQQHHHQQQQPNQPSYSSSGQSFQHAHPQARVPQPPTPSSALPSTINCAGVGSNSSSSGGGGGGKATFFAGSPQQHSAPPGVGSFAPTFDSNFAMRPPSRSSTSVQSPLISASPPVVASPASATIPISLCSPPVLPALSKNVSHHLEGHSSLPPPPPPYQTTTSLMETIHRSPYQHHQTQSQQQPGTPTKANTPASASGLEEAGFEPPVIFSRVGGAGKERPRFVPQQQQQQQHLMEGFGEISHGMPSTQVPGPPASLTYASRVPAQQHHYHQQHQNLTSHAMGHPQFESEFHYTHTQSPSNILQHQAPVNVPPQFFAANTHSQPSTTSSHHVTAVPHVDDSISEFPPDSTPSGCYAPPTPAVEHGAGHDASISSYSECSGQYLILDSQPTQYSGGFLVPAYSSARQPVPSGYDSVAAGGRTDYIQAVPQQPSNIYESVPAQSQPRSYMAPQYNPYTISRTPYPRRHLPQPDVPGHMRRLDDKHPHPGSLQ